MPEGSDRRYRCNKCGEVFETREGLQSHCLSDLFADDDCSDEPEGPPTISELIETLEAIREEEGDLPVVVVEGVRHVWASPKVRDGDSRWSSGGVDERRVEL